MLLLIISAHFLTAVPVPLYCTADGLVESKGTQVIFNNYQFGSSGYPIGTKATYRCDQFYEITSGWRVRTCQASGEWDGWPAICEKSKDEFSYNRFYNFSHKKYYICLVW